MLSQNITKSAGLKPLFYVLAVLRMDLLIAFSPRTQAILFCFFASLMIFTENSTRNNVVILKKIRFSQFSLYVLLLLFV